MTRLRLRTRLTAALALVAPAGCYAPLPRADEPDRSMPRPASAPGPSREAPRPAAPVVPASAVLPAVPDPAAPLTLEQLEDLAQAHNPILQRDLAKLES